MEPARPQGAVAPVPAARLLVGSITLLGVLGAGLLGGWVAARQGGASAGGHAGHAHGGGEEAHAETPVLSPRALANLGVVVGPARLGEHVRMLEVPGTAERPVLAERAVVSPVAGVLRAVRAAPGSVVAAGAPLAEVLRDPLPTPVLALTEPILEPLNEAHHEAAVAVRRAALALELARSERERLAALGGAAPEAAPGRVLREAEYAVRRALLDLESAEHEAERHGMSAEQVAALRAGGEEGAEGVPDVPDVRRVLQRNRLWSAAADDLLALLPAAERERPHTLAVLGELAASGRLSDALVEAARREPRLAARFLEAAGLLQQGASPEALAALAAAGGLEALVVLRAPQDGAPDYDVSALHLRPGERVEAGAEVLHLVDDRQMHLRLAPAPSDLAALAGLLQQAQEGPPPLTAQPLVPGAAEPLAEVRLLRLLGTEGTAAGALAVTANRPLAQTRDAAGALVRTWSVRPGSAWRVLVPVERVAGRFVLPADAIAYRGAEAVVLAVDGDTFRPIPVRLETHDAEHAVVAADGALFPGNVIVLHGAPALGMALLAGSGAADPHAGHSH